jgi:phosphoglycolate phosphatase
VTNKRSDLSELLLGKIDLTRHFAAIVGPDRVSERKPSGAHLIEAITAVGGDRSRAVMVGDAAPDAGTAKAANIPCVLVSFGYTPIPVEDLGGDIIVDAFEDVEEAVDMIVVDHYVNKAMFGG